MINTVIMLIPLQIFLASTALGNDVKQIYTARAELPTAENFSLESLNGDRKISLEEFKGKAVVINFWASWCSPCKEEMPLMEKLWNTYKDKDVVFIGIDVMDNRDSAAELIKKMGITYYNLSDPSGKVLSKYGVTGLPASVFINKEGKIAFKNYGPFLGKEGVKKFKTILTGIDE